MERSGGFFGAFLAAISLALAALVVLLALQNRSLKREIEDLHAAAVGRDKDLLVEGDVFPPLDLTDASGAPLRLAFDGGGSPRTLLLVFSPDCPACQETLPIWEGIVGADSDPSMDVVGLRLEAAGAAHPHDLPADIPIFDPVDPAALPLERLLVPATFVVDAHGFIERAVYGVLSSRQTRDIEGMLHP